MFIISVVIQIVKKMTGKLSHVKINMWTRTYLKTHIKIIHWEMKHSKTLTQLQINLMIHQVIYKSYNQ